MEVVDHSHGYLLQVRRRGGHDLHLGLAANVRDGAAHASASRTGVRVGAAGWPIDVFYLREKVALTIGLLRNAHQQYRFTLRLGIYPVPQANLVSRNAAVFQN